MRNSSLLSLVVKRSLLAAGLLVTPILPCSAAAQQVDSSDLAAQACLIAKFERTWDNIAPIPDAKDEKSEWVAIDPQRLWFFAATRAGIEVSPDSARRRATAAFDNVNDDRQPRFASDFDWSLFNTIKALQDNISADAIDTLKIYDAQNKVVANAPTESSRFWLAAHPGIVRCKVEKKKSVVGGGTLAEGDTSESKTPKFVLDFNLRENPEGLALTGKERKSAGAAQLGLERVRSFLDDGSRKQVTTLTGKGVLGLKILPQTDDTSLFAYGGYELSRSRTRPATLPTPPATLRDGDTEIIKIGLVGRQYFDLVKGPKANRSMTVSIDGSYLFDLVKDSERLRGKVTLSPYWFVKPGGICGIREFHETIIPGVRARCTPDILFQYGHVTRDGKLDADDKKDHVMFGGRIAYDLMLSGDLESGVFAGASYEYQKRISGGVPSIRRHRLYVKYRLWAGNDFAVDIGPELIDGINPDSFANENQLVLKTGLIF